MYGEWCIDFTAPDFISNGIFALTGPTGAGKSTILDAICLALYGATPRLGRITKTNNDIMSRQTGECYAEVVFESQVGQFRCHWEHRKARKKADGALQEPEHQIADATTGKVIENKKSLLSSVIEEKTGMDFDRFTRSILLAQGGFDTFLKADEEQKSKILEQITGTEIYSAISQCVHERQREEANRLDFLKKETSDIVLLSPEQESIIIQDFERLKIEEIQRSATLEKLKQAITWLSEVERLKTALNTCLKESDCLITDVNAFEFDRKRLALANQAAQLDLPYEKLTALRASQKKDLHTLCDDEMALAALTANVSEKTTLLQQLEQVAVQAKESLTAALPLIRDMRERDQKLLDQKQAITVATMNCNVAQDKVEKSKISLTEAREKLNSAEKQRLQIEAYLVANAQDESLVSELTGVEVQISTLISYQEILDQKKQNEQQASNALNASIQKQKTFIDACEVSKKVLGQVSEKSHQAEINLKKLLGDYSLREYRAEYQAKLLEMASVKQIAAFESHRAALEDGKECPLCGAKDHPFAIGNVPLLTEVEIKIEELRGLIGNAEAQEIDLVECKSEEDVARNRLRECQHSEANALRDYQIAEKVVADAVIQVKAAQADCEQLQQKLLVKLQPFGIDDLLNTKADVLLSTLKNRLQAWQKSIAEKNALEKQLDKINSELNSITAVMGEQTQSLTEKQRNLSEITQAYQIAMEDRQTRYGDKLSDDEEQRLNRVVEVAEQAEKQSRQSLHDVQQKFTSKQDKIAELKKHVLVASEQLEKLEAEWLVSLSATSFENEEAFKASILNTGERQIFLEKERSLNERKIALDATKKEREARLAEEISKNITDQDKTELTQRLDAEEVALKASRSNLATLEHRLGENAAAKKRIEDKQAAIDTQKKECQRWDKLHVLIGSVDGKKYRNFAQGLTFELMVSHANRQLEKMTDRYLLIRDPEKSLALNVIDNYQAGEVRTTKNLSGGESFIVSLTLALGLSKMASRRVRVDSLFLDEGFGTLDEEALESALETLSGLQQDGKLIGVISHVPALKERISTQIVIAPTSSGRSMISGPGCGQFMLDSVLEKNVEMV